MSSFSSRRLDGKVSIVTGSSSGIGERTALLLAAKGASIALCGRNKDRLEGVRAECGRVSGGHPERFIVVAGDITDPSVRARTVDETVNRFGRLDILVANAGEAQLPASFADVTEENWDGTVDILLKAVTFLIQESYPHLEKTKGVIAVVSSVGGLYHAPYQWPYNCVKAALNQLVRVLAIPLGAKGVRINATCPGFVRTNILRGFGEKMESIYDQFEETAKPFHPLGNRVSTVEEQSDVITFLVSEESSYVHGEVIPVDGLQIKICPGLNHNYYLPTGLDSVCE